PYRLPAGVDFAELPHYASLARPAEAMIGSLRALRSFWRVLGEVDAVWLLGPHPLAIVVAPLAALRGKRVALGVRQDLVSYARTRRPGRRDIQFLARALELMYRGLARAFSVVAIGSDLAARYGRARRVLDATVSLVPEASIAEPEALVSRAYDGELTVLSVGRLDAEKNPLLLADVLARLDARWRLVVCGDGPLADDLEQRLDELGVSDRAELRGYVPVHGGLDELYRSSHAFLHVSWTEGMPQVLIEAFAARLPVVATDVGGVEALASGAALLVPPGDPDAAARALERIAAEPSLRDELTSAGADRARQHSLEAESSRVAEFLEDA
ncbi:MAG: glycosyltransferase family 4 protein, partial [Thermoleophilaceae bacterium]